MILRRSELPRATQRQLTEHSVAGTAARAAAELVGVNRNTGILYYHGLRDVIAERIRDESPFGGELERVAHDPDEGYSGGHRKGARGRGAAGKAVVVGILQRGGRAYAAVPANLKRATLLPIIRERVERVERVEPDTVAHTEGLPVYDPLNASGFEHYRIEHSEGFADYDASGRAAHINGIANFWGQVKRHLRRYDGIPEAHSELFRRSASGCAPQASRWSNSAPSG